MAMTSTLDRAPAATPSFAKALAALDRDGFAVVENITDADDVAEIRACIDKIVRSGVEFRELGERIGATRQILEFANVMALAPQIRQSRFFRRAKEFSAAYLDRPVEHSFDHIIIKPPMNNKETAWHQDSAYSRRLTFTKRRVHWWLPLHDVSVERGCMQYVPGTHRSPRMKHVPVAPTSDALRTYPEPGARIVTCPVRAGSATVHLPNTLHYTGPNLTTVPREAFIIQFSARSLVPELTM
jgi:ectoine hydroxylase-related dioxygenase (phytanoyl-CoA dioxygenase family)